MERVRLPMVIIVPTHGRPVLLGRAIDSILACNAPGDRSVRLIVVENGGQFGAERLCAGKGSWLRPEYQYFAQANKSLALNSVISGLDECLAIFFDDDIRVDPSILLYYSAASGPKLSGEFYGGGVLVDYEEEPPPWLVKHLPVSAVGWHPRVEDYRGVANQLAFLGCNWAAFSHDIKAAGGFDRRFGPGGTSGGTGQERAMQIALQAAGVLPRYVHDALVWHYVPQDRCSVRWSLQRLYRNAIRAGHESPVDVGQPRIAGVAVPLLKRAVRQGVQVARSWWRDDPERRYNKLATLATTLGQIKGMRDRVRAL